MASLILANRHSNSPVATFDDHVQQLPGGLEVLVGPVSADAAVSLDRELAVAGPAVFPDGIDTVVDCGRILADVPGQSEIFKGADHVVVVIRPDAAGLAARTVDARRHPIDRDNGTDRPCDCRVQPISGSRKSSRLSRRHSLSQSRSTGSQPPWHAVLRESRRDSRQSNLVASVRRLVDRILQSPDPASRSLAVPQRSHEHRARGLSATPPQRASDSSGRFERTGSRSAMKADRPGGFLGLQTSCRSG